MKPDNLLRTFRSGEPMPDGARKVPLSVLVPTRNEERNIERCLRSVSWAAQVFVVDSHSTDRTAEIARRWAPMSYPFAGMGGGPGKRTGPSIISPGRTNGCS